MTLVYLDMTTTWITSLNDNTISVQARKVTREETDGVVGNTVNYGGRTTAEATSEKTRSSTLTLYLDSDADLDQLREWWQTSEPVLLRDALGWHRTGTFFSGTITDRRPTRDTNKRAIQVVAEFRDVDWNFEV